MMAIYRNTLHRNSCTVSYQRNLADTQPELQIIYTNCQINWTDMRVVLIFPSCSLQ